MGLDRPENSAPGQAGQAGQTYRVPASARGGTQGISIYPVPPPHHHESTTEYKDPVCPTGDRFTLTLRALPDPGGPAPARRLARGLKYLLRACRLRCVRIEPAAQADEGKDQTR
jgi:hypothetical protein